MTGAVVLVVVLAGLLLMACPAVLIYNRLVRSRIFLREGFSGIDVQLKRRHDLIPNLVSTVEGYAGLERGVLKEVAGIFGFQLAEFFEIEHPNDAELPQVGFKFPREQ